MAARASDERSRIRAARYTPGPSFEEEIEMTLKKLPPRRHVPMARKILTASSVAAALALFVVLAAPPIVRAAAELYQRLFGQVVEDIEREQALPEDQRLPQLISDSWSCVRWHRLEGCDSQFGGVTVSVSTVSVAPEDRFSNDHGGVLSVSLTYSQLPPFDPSWVDFACVVDGREIPMAVDEDFQKYYRDAGLHTRTEEEWNDGWSGSNSTVLDGIPTTVLHFKLEDWRWDTAKSLKILADIDGQSLALPFSFDPDKARAQAESDARQSLQLGATRYAEEKDQLSDMATNATSVGLTGSAYGHDWVVSEISYADSSLYFSVTFGGVEETNPNIVGFDYWLEDVSVDGISTGDGGSSNDRLLDQSYSAIYRYSLDRNAESLPESSLIAFTLILGGPDRVQHAAFEYNWQSRRVTLPQDTAQMADWYQRAKRQSFAG